MKFRHLCARLSNGVLVALLLSAFTGCTLQQLMRAGGRPGPPPATETGDAAIDAVPRPEATVNAAEPPAAAAAAGKMPAQTTGAGGAPGTDGMHRRPVLQLSTTVAARADLWARLRANYALPPAPPERIESEIRWFQRNQAYLDRIAGRATRYLHYLVGELEARGLPGELALLPVIESGFQPFAYSPGRAAGLWQFIPSTARRWGLKVNWWYDGRRDVVASTRAALAYLEQLHNVFAGDWLLAIAAYNSGEGAVKKAMARNRRAGKPLDFWALRRHLPRETRAYVPRFLAVVRIVGDPARHGVTLAPIPDRRYFDIVELDGQLDLALAAEMAGISMRELYLLNPAFNRWATDPDGPHRLLVPAGGSARLQSALARLPPRQRITWKRHVIRRGETLGEISHHYHTTVAVLQQVNELRGTLIRAGRALMVPVAARAPERYVLSADARQTRSTGRRGSGARSTYVVRRGDSLWTIARRHRVSVADLVAWNGLQRRAILRPGKTLVMWQPTAAQLGQATTALSGTGELARNTTRRIRYTVRRGDSLWQISRRFNVTVALLRKWNGLSRGRYLQPGQQLHVVVDVTRQAESG